MKRRCMGCMEVFDDELAVCPYCGYIAGTPAGEVIHMQPGTLLHYRYIIGRVIGYGGFGVTYIGWDGKLEQKVAVKEYLPGEFSTRMPGQSRVTVFNGDKSEQFRDGMKKFVEEAKRLAKFQNEEGIVKVFDSFEENDTAYIIMEFLDGETLTSCLERRKTIPEDEAVAMLMPVMESLQVVHAAGILHRDIAPDNIFLTKNGGIKLIDFGASRYATTSHSRSLTVIIKTGFSPEEQYRGRGNQGPHTDVYALAATLYKMMTGKTPPDAMERWTEYESRSRDILKEPHKINKNISVNRENAILNAMNVRIEDRTPDVTAFVKELNADPPAKRIYGKIKKTDLYSWPLWAKICLPLLLACLITAGTLFAVRGIGTGGVFSEEIVIPENIVAVPDVEGMYSTEAFSLIESSGLLASTGGNVESEYIDVGKIMLQTPVGGSYMDKNGTVVLTVSAGKGVESPEDGILTVPYVIWDTQQDAIDKLKLAGFNEPEIEEEYDEQVAAGAVISQSINAGEKVDEGTIIKLVVSVGPSSFKMPDVKGQSITEAEAALTGKGLIVSIEYEENDNLPQNSVIRQSISEGFEVKRGDKIVLVVASRKKTKEVAGVVGKTGNDAEKILKDQGFKVKILENYDTNVEAGKVISQSPSAGSAQIEGAVITIYVSRGKQPVKVSFDANGGTVGQTVATVYYSSTYGSLPTPTRSGYNFGGWFTSANGGTMVDANTKVTLTGSHTLYARWSAGGYTVNLNANGGTVTPNSITAKYGSAYGSLPTPVRTGYTFKGWFTGQNGGKQITSSSLVESAANHTLYAQWTEKPVSDWSETVPSGAITVDKKTQYSYRDKSFKESESDSLSGWTRYDSYVSYGSWTNDGWTKNKPTESSTLRISDTRTVTDSDSYTRYHLYHWKYWNPSYGYYMYTYGPTYAQSMGYSVTKNTVTALSSEFYKEKSYEGHQAYRLYKDTVYMLWWIESTETVPAVTHTEWYCQKRSATTVYKYYQWGSWSNYGDTVVNATENREVRTKTLYRYREK